MKEYGELRSGMTDEAGLKRSLWARSCAKTLSFFRITSSEFFTDQKSRISHFSIAKLRPASSSRLRLVTVHLATRGLRSDCFSGCSTSIELGSTLRLSNRSSSLGLDHRYRM